jgi:hypothetical protein
VLLEQRVVYLVSRAEIIVQIENEGYLNVDVAGLDVRVARDDTGLLLVDESALDLGLERLPESARVLNHLTVPDNDAREPSDDLRRDEVLAHVREAEDDPLLSRKVLEAQEMVDAVRREVDQGVTLFDGRCDDRPDEQLVDVCVLDRLVVFLPAEVDERDEDLLLFL